LQDLNKESRMETTLHNMKLSQVTSPPTATPP